ncbi:MAG: hypothetical protein RL557_694 [archaeon]
MLYESVIFGLGFIALLFALFLFLKLKQINVVDPKVAEISRLIKEGAKSYLTKQYKILGSVAIVITIILAIFVSFAMAGSFFFGALLSSVAGILGMMVATSANAKTTEGCKKSLNEGLKVAFSSGVVMGMIVVGLGILGIISTYVLFKDMDVMFGFGLGASLIALFARVGGGIYTKAADMGADLVGKVEKGIPEDDPRNPAVIADNVGDNVGDVAGMGADLFDSYVHSIIASMALALLYFNSNGLAGALFPLFIAAIGIIASILGTFFVRLKENDHPHKALNRGMFASSFFVIIFSLAAVLWIFGAAQLALFYSIVTGLIAGIIIGLATEHYTSDKRKPVISIAKASETGPATNVVRGLSVGMMSTLIPAMTIIVAILLSFKFAGLFGVSLTAIGMLSILGVILATDTYGPVSDNAAGIAEMAGLKGDVRKRAEELDAVGNTTAAIGKGFAVGSAVLTALALFSVFAEKAQLTTINMLDPLVLSGALIGGILSFIFAALVLNSVGKTAYAMVNEVRRQFRENKDLMKGKAKPDYDRPIQISTQAALKEMMLPGILSIIVPLLVGLIMGLPALGGLLAGMTITAFLLAVTLSNAGGAWDNAKKYIEKGNLGGKGSDAHKAAVVGDTVGDGAKDAAGPSLNIMIKLVSIVALLLAIVLMA